MIKVKNLLFSLVILLFIGNTTFAQSINFDKKLGKNNFELVVNTYGLYKDSSMNEYLNKVGQRLVSNLDSAFFEYKFYIVKNEVPNAFALPGGYIFITTSLIPILKTEDELAGIIGHEIIHSNNRHSVRQMKKKIIPSIITLPIVIIGDIIPVIGTLTSPIMSAEELLFASYSRKFETEADKQGVALAAKAGYDPLALPRALNRLTSTLEYVTGEKEQKSYFSDHPYTPDREKEINNIVDNLVINKSDIITKDFVMEFDGILYGRCPYNGIVKDSTLLQLKRDFYIQFPNDWAIENNDSIVFSYNKNKDAAYVLSFDDEKLSPKEAGDIFIKNLPPKNKDMYRGSRIIKVNELEAYVLQFENYYTNDTNFTNVAWLRVGDNLFKISTMSNIKDNIVLLDITKTIRPLTKAEKESIMIKYIKIVTAKENETITDVCKRTNNKVNSELIAVINGFDINDKLKEGQEIKIVLEKAYLQK